MKMLLIGGIFESFRSLKDKTLKLTFETNEPSPDQFSQIINHIQKFGFLAFKEDIFKESEKKLLLSLESNYQEKGKTKSQRLRAVLYKNFEQENLGYKVFDDYYNRKMEELINHYKSNLN